MQKLSQKTKSFIILTIIFALLITTIAGVVNFLQSSTKEQTPYKTYYGKNITYPQYQVFYVLSVNEFIDKYALYLDTWGLDVNKDFSAQQYDDEHTWEEAFQIQTENQIKQFVVLNKDIENTKTKVDVSEQVDELIDIFKQNAESVNETYEEYISELFGPEVTDADIREVVDYKYKAIEYSNILDKKIKDVITDKDLMALYTSHPASFDEVTFRMVSFTGDDSHDKAHEFEESIETEDDFIEKAKEITDEDTLFTDIGASTLDNDNITAWIYDDERKNGDIDIIESDDMYYVVYFKSREICSDPTVDFRHIYFNTRGASAVEKSDIKEKAEKVFEELKSTDMSKETFSSYAFIYSDDTLTSSLGGLLEGTRKDSIEEELNTWLFDDSRKAGDIELIETQIGYHIVYFEQKGDEYWKVMAKNYLASEEYDKYIKNIEDKLNSENEE